MGKTTKSGKREMNPTDAYRKEQRKRELKRNKKERKRVREIGSYVKDPGTLKQEIDKMEKMVEAGTLENKFKGKLDALRRLYPSIVKLHQRKKAMSGKSIEEEEERLQQILDDMEDGEITATGGASASKASAAAEEGYNPKGYSQPAPAPALMPPLPPPTPLVYHPDASLRGPGGVPIPPPPPGPPPVGLMPRPPPGPPPGFAPRADGAAGVAPRPPPGPPPGMPPSSGAAAAGGPAVPRPPPGPPPGLPPSAVPMGLPRPPPGPPPGLPPGSSAQSVSMPRPPPGPPPGLPPGRPPATMPMGMLPRPPQGSPYMPMPGMPMQHPMMHPMQMARGGVSPGAMGMAGPVMNRGSAGPPPRAQRVQSVADPLDPAAAMYGEYRQMTYVEHVRGQAEAQPLAPGPMQGPAMPPPVAAPMAAAPMPEAKGGDDDDMGPVMGPSKPAPVAKELTTLVPAALRIRRPTAPAPKPMLMKPRVVSATATRVGGTVAQVKPSNSVTSTAAVAGPAKPAGVGDSYDAFMEELKTMGAL